MKLTKYTHACVRIEDGDRRLVIDPGTFSEVPEALSGVDAVLVTHEHVDHLDRDRLLAAARANPRLRLWAPGSVVRQLEELGDRATAVAADESFDAGGLQVRAFGGKHAVVHPSMGTPCENLSYLVEDSIYHPGDSFFVPPATVQLLLVPMHAPWSKLAEVVDFLVAVRAPAACQVHDAMLSDLGVRSATNFLTQFGERYGTTFRYLSAGEHI